MANSARAMEDLVSILRSREPLYAKADVALSTSGRSPEQNVAELLRLIEVPDTRMARQRSGSPTLDKERVSAERTDFEPSWPPLCRPSASFLVDAPQVVDARDKPGHDVESFRFSARPSLWPWAPARRNERILF